MDFSRQRDILEEFDTPIVIIGAGSIGSFVCLTLAKMGATNITIYDDDRIESHNIPNQFFRLEDVGYSKVGSLYDIVSAFTGVDIEIETKKFDATDFKPNKKVFRGIMISAIDSMNGRIEIWNIIKNKLPGLYMDIRMGGENASIHCVWDEESKEKYEKTLYPDDEMLGLPCGQRSIIYTILGTSALAARKVKAYLKNEPLVSETLINFNGEVIMKNESPAMLKKEA